MVSHSVVSDSSWPNGLQPTRLLCPWNFPSKNTGVGCHVLLQGIFPTQGLSLGLLRCRWILYRLSHQGRWQIIYLFIYPPSHTHTCTRAHTHILLVLLSLSISFSRGFSLSLDSLNQQQGISNSRCVRLTEGVFLIIPKMQWVPFSQFGFSKSGMGLKMCIFTVSSVDSHAYGERVTFEKHCSAYSFWRISSILLSLTLSMRWLLSDLFLLAITLLIPGFYNCFTFSYLFLKQLISLFPL